MGNLSPGDLGTNGRLWEFRKAVTNHRNDQPQHGKVWSNDSSILGLRKPHIQTRNLQHCVFCNTRRIDHSDRNGVDVSNAVALFFDILHNTNRTR